jgi:uncharacterized protein
MPSVTERLIQSLRKNETTEINSPDEGTETTIYYVALLWRGPQWTRNLTNDNEKVQEAHRLYIRAIGASGELILAGPFLDDSPICGIYLLKVKSLEEARNLVELDPSVQSGRLMVELHPWEVPDGILP